MNDNHKTPQTPQPMPQPLCHTFEPLLPLLSMGELEADEAVSLRAHLDSCAWCQQRLRQYATVGVAIQHQFAVDESSAIPAALLSLLSEERMPATDNDTFRADRSLSQVIERSAMLPSRSARHVHSRFTGFAALAAVVLLALLAAGIFGALAPRLARSSVGNHAKATLAPRATPTAPALVAINPQTSLPFGGELKTLQAMASNNVWALGYAPVTSLIMGKATPTPVAPGKWESYNFFGHFDGQKWAVIPVLDTNITLTSLSMDSATDGWAVGGTNDTVSHGVLFHYTDGQWKRVSMPGIGPLSKVRMLSATEGWVLGDVNGDQTQPESAHASLILHYEDGAWNVAPNRLARGAMIDLSMDSASHGWVVGFDGRIGRYSGGQWTEWPQSGGGDLQSISSPSATNAWAVGQTRGSPTSQPAPIVLHFDGHAWVPVTIPTLGPAALLSQVTMVSTNDGWLIGTKLAPLGVQPVQETPLLLHYINGQWQQVTLPSVAFSFISMSSASDGWAIGMTIPTDAKGVSSKPLLLRYHDGTWSVYGQLAS